MKFKGLKFKLIGRFIFCFTILMIILTFVMGTWVNNSYFNFIKSEMSRQSDIIEEHVVPYLEGQNNSEMHLRKIIDVLAVAENVDILLADNIGIVYMTSHDSRSEYAYKNVEFNEESYSKLKRGETLDIKVENNEFVYVEPIHYNGYFYGAILVVIPSNVVYQNLGLLIKVFIIVSVIIIIANSIIISITTKKIIIKPLNNVIKISEKISKGDVDKRVDIDSSDEIGQLAESFNIMAESLECVDKNRRDFISNVSHELRTPITSIKGFISAILDGVVPKEKESYYLNIVYDEIKRLARLVNDLLDVSSLETGKFNLSIQEVDIISTIKVCIWNLEGRVKDKNMSIEFIYENDQELVLCDKDRMVQVLTNLIDNAIKYGKENGKIKIFSEVKGTKLYISIYNNGQPLNREEMIKIWDRFYMVDKSRTHKLSTGLGLSIVRLILTQHGEDIWVNSGSEEGVTFTFSIKRV